MGVFFIAYKQAKEVRKITIRYDTINIQKAKFTEDGYLEDSPIVTRTGVFNYLNPDGTVRREYRPPEEVFNADSLATLKGKPITLKHPSQQVTANNAKRLVVGTVLSEGKQDNMFMRADIVVYDKSAIDSGSRELSLGYKTDLVETPGISPEGEMYHAVQTNLRYNHLAIVERGRAGSMARLNLDSMDQELDEEEPTLKQDEGEKIKMEQLKLDSGLTYEVPPEVVVAFNQLKADAVLSAEELKKKAEKEKAMQAEMDAKEAKCDTLQAQVDKCGADVAQVKKDAEDAIESAVKSRIEILKVADKFKLDKADEMTDKDIKLAVIKTVRGDAMDLTAKSEDYIQAAFDLCKEESKGRNDGIESQRKAVGGKLPTDKREDSVATSGDARQKMIERTKLAFNKGDK